MRTAASLPALLVFALLGAGAPGCEDAGLEEICQDGCPLAGARRCLGDAVEACAEGVDGCLAWTPADDCGARGETCRTRDELSAECAAPCASTCAPGAPKRCLALALEGCVEVPSDPGCFHWTPLACLTDEDCAPCEDGARELVCTAGGGCACAVGCGTDGLTCCRPDEVCADTDPPACCLPACEGLVCGPDPACGVLCHEQGCGGATFSLTAGWKYSEGDFLTQPPSLVLQGGEVLVLAHTQSISGGPLALLRFLVLTGELVEQRFVAGGGPENWGVMRAAGAGLVLGGGTLAWEFDTGRGWDAWLAGLNPDRSVAWAQLYGTLEAEVVHDVQPLPPPSAGFVAAGERLVAGEGQAALVLEVGADGGLLHAITLGDAQADLVLYALVPLVEGDQVVGYLGAGAVSAPRGTGEPQPWLARLSADLALVDWQVRLDAGAPGAVRALLPDGAERLLAVGEVGDPQDGGRTDAWAATLDGETGALLWQRRYALPGSDERVASLTRAADGDLLLAGRTALADEAGGEEGWLLEIGALSGAVRWQRRFGGPGDDALSALVATFPDDPAGGYLAAGLREFAHLATDVWLLRLDEAGALGQPGCAEPLEAPTAALAVDAGFVAEATVAVPTALALQETHLGSQFYSNFVDETSVLARYPDCP